MGGTFAPSLFFGAATGSFFQRLHVMVQSWALGSPVASVFAPAYSAIGAAACLASVFRAPITGIVLLFELTRSYYIVLPMIAAVAFATLTIDVLERAGTETTRGWTGLGDDKQLKQMSAIAGVAEMPMDELTAAFDAGATHCIVWRLDEDDNEYKAAANYVTPRLAAELRKKRGDDLTFASESILYTFPADGDEPIATCGRERREIVMTDVSGCRSETMSCFGLRRQALAIEFGVRNLHFVPVEHGVLEYGTGGTAEFQKRPPL